MNKHRLRQTLDELETSHTMLGAIVKSSRPNWRSELVQARRALAEALGQLANSLNGDEDTHILNAGERDAIRARLSAFRSALALHQAAFPAVTIVDGGDPHYNASAKMVRSAAADLFAFARTLPALA